MTRLILPSLAALICLSQARRRPTMSSRSARRSPRPAGTPYDLPVMDGFAVAMDEINAAGGIAGKYKVEVETRDNRSDNAQNAIVTQDLIDQGVNFLLVACDSSMVHATAELIVTAQLPAISTCSSSPTLPLTGHGFIFANAVTDNVQGAAQAEYA